MTKNLQQNFYVKGFKAAAVEAEIKYKGRLDLGLIYSEVPAVIAGVFTDNQVKAAPVIKTIERLKEKEPYARAILVNSGNANACTGHQGLDDVNLTTELIARELNIPPDEVLAASTGVIGARLPVDRIAQAAPRLCSSLHESGLEQVAQAIMTTDSRQKISVRDINLDGFEVRILGIAKGAGMIGPDMSGPHATMLAFVLTNALISPVYAQNCLENATEKSFNRILVDGDTSTNDTVLLMANGLTWEAEIEENKTYARAFEAALDEVLAELANMIVEDGEGAHHRITINVTRARTHEDAKQIARTIAQSPLVKTAFFGRDPNWGRIFAAAGRSQAIFEQDTASLFIGDVLVVKRGIAIGEEAEAKAKAVMSAPVYDINLEVGLGDASYYCITCDFSLDYVKINADYRT